MTNTAINIACAEAVGWSDLRMGTSCLIGTSPSGLDSWMVPAFLTDWNTRPQMLRVLEDRRLLSAFTVRFSGPLHVAITTQPEFCEKFLKVLGLWKCE